MALKDWYSPEEDELIKATATADIDALATKLGRKRINLMNRRQRLLRGDLPWRMHNAPKPEPDPVARKPDVLVGRPTWFEDENLGTRMRGRRA